MKKIRNLTELNYQLEIEKIRREVELDKLKSSIQKTKNSLFPSLLSFALSNIFKKKRKQ